MRSNRTAHWIALTGGVAVFLITIVLLKMRSWMPFAVGGFAYLALFLALMPGRRPSPKAHKPAEPATDHDRATAALAEGAADLRKAIAKAPAADAPLFDRMADLLESIAGHVRANPDHTTRTRVLVRHALPRIVGIVEQYTDLLRRAGPAHEDWLAEVSRDLEAFVPALERVDRACLDNDLTELEISVEVLNTQITRR